MFNEILKLKRHDANNQDMLTELPFFIFNDIE